MGEGFTLADGEGTGYRRLTLFGLAVMALTMLALATRGAAAGALVLGC